MREMRCREFALRSPLLRSPLSFPCASICFACIRAYACSQSCAIEEYIIRHESGDEVFKTAVNFARNRKNSGACKGQKSVGVAVVY